MRTESGDHFVEDQHGAVLFGDSAKFAQVLDGLEIRTTALHRLQQHCREFVRARADDFKRFRCAVVQHEHVLDRRLQNTGRGRHRAQLLRATHQHFVEDAVIRTRKDHDQIAACDRARNAHRTHHSL